MRHKDPERMRQINTYISEFYMENGRTPSTTEIAKAFGIARSTAYYYLVAMDKEKVLSYQNGEIQINRMDKLDVFRSKAPVVGTVPCGELSYEEESVECVTTLPKAIFGEGPFYILHASGDSMEDEGIDSGDLLVIRQNASPRNGDLVVALDEENRNTLKKYGGVDPESGKFILRYCNQAVYGDRKILVSELVSQGVVSHVIKEK